MGSNKTIAQKQNSDFIKYLRARSANLRAEVELLELRVREMEASIKINTLEPEFNRVQEELIRKQAEAQSKKSNKLEAVPDEKSEDTNKDES